MSPTASNRVALVSAPWALFNRPSIQLGALKAYLRSVFPDLDICAHHLFLEVAVALGYARYRAVSEKSWLAETVYAALLYPERRETIAALFFKEAAGRPALKGLDFGQLTEAVRRVTDTFVERIAWDELLLAGFSACLCQMTATLYLIRRIKARFPGVFAVVGGSTFAGDCGRRIRTVFPEIDAVVSGEGELPLSRLVGELRKGASPAALDRIPGVAAGPEQARREPMAVDQLPDLETLPPPDYEDYFQILSRLTPQQRFFPVLPAEVSRGCRWARPVAEGRPRGCAFCNLNLQWRGYRSKSPAKAATEIAAQSDRYRVLSVALTDNLIPASGALPLFDRLSETKKDFKIFCEIRATTSRRALAGMRSAGVDEVQVGIEALSTRLLKKLNKGTTAIANLEIMRNCEELGIVNASNLILQFPGSDRADVAETLGNLPFCLPFRPLRQAVFYLGLGSPVWENPRAYGVQAVFNHPNYRRLFPRSVCEAVDFMVQGYRGGTVAQRKLWRPVREALRRWRKEYLALHSSPYAGPVLSYRDGGGFLILRQRRLSGRPLTHRLDGVSREIYLFCRHRRSLKQILSRFPNLGGGRTVAFLRMMTDKRLMFAEADRYLSLAAAVSDGSSKLKN